MNTKVKNKPKFEKWALTLNWAQASNWEKWTPARAYKMNTKVENKPKIEKESELEKWALTLNWAQASKWGQAYKWVQYQDEPCFKNEYKIKAGP